MADKYPPGTLKTETLAAEECSVHTTALPSKWRDGQRARVVRTATPGDGRGRCSGPCLSAAVRIPFQGSRGNSERTLSGGRLPGSSRTSPLRCGNRQASSCCRGEMSSWFPCGRRDRVGAHIRFVADVYKPSTTDAACQQLLSFSAEWLPQHPLLFLGPRTVLSVQTAPSLHGLPGCGISGST